MQQKQPLRKCDLDAWSGMNDAVGAREHHHPLTHDTEMSGTNKSLLEFDGSTICQALVPFISHDIRHHLASLNCNIEFMVAPNTQQKDREYLMAEVRGAIHDMIDLLDSVLLSVRTERIVHLETKSMNLLIERSVAMVRSHPDARECEFIIREAPSIQAHIDSQRLGAAVYNLLLNACQALKRSSSPKKVEIELGREDRCIYIVVQDNGEGVPDSIRDILFEPYVSAKGLSGTGIGLTIAEQAVRAHGGSLRLKESGPGKTVFVLKLPNRAFSFPFTEELSE